MKFSITGQVKGDLLIQVTTGSSRHNLIRHLQTWLSWIISQKLYPNTR